VFQNEYIDWETKLQFTYTIALKNADTTVNHIYVMPVGHLKIWR